MKKKLIVNADDFGQSEGVNSGIIQAFENGIVTSASLMVRYSAAIHAAEYSKNNMNLSLGLHLDLGEWIYSNENWIPLYEVVSLDDPNAIREEIISQLEAFYKITGRKPTHIDSHQHIHQRELIRPIIIEIAKELNVTLRGIGQKIKYCGDFYGQSSHGSPLPSAISIDKLKQIIANVPVGMTELGCHPGLNSDLKTMYSFERAIEVDTLCDQGIRKAIADANIELCSFNDIPF